MKYAFIEEHREEFSVELMCDVLNISKSGYWDWRKRDKTPIEAKRNDLLEKIVRVHHSSRKTYGSPRVYKILKGMGMNCSKSTIERLMRENGIRAKTWRKFKATTHSNHDYPVARNVINRDFSTKAPNRLWCTDITYLWTLEGWLYLAVILDAFTRKIVGWAMNERMTQSLVSDALEMAVNRQKPKPGLIHHSDRGTQYAADDYQDLLQKYAMICSMSRKGDCWDNAMAESFFHTLKTEHVYHEQFKTRCDAKSSVFEWIEVFYNRQRIHSAIGFVSPECYERLAA